MTRATWAWTATVAGCSNANYCGSASQINRILFQSVPQVPTCCTVDEGETEKVGKDSGHFFLSPLQFRTNNTFRTVSRVDPRGFFSQGYKHSLSHFLNNWIIRTFHYNITLANWHGRNGPKNLRLPIKQCVALDQCARQKGSTCEHHRKKSGSRLSFFLVSYPRI